MGFFVFFSNIEKDNISNNNKQILWNIGDFLENYFAYNQTSSRILLMKLKDAQRILAKAEIIYRDIIL